MGVEPIRVGWCCDWAVPADQSVQPDALRLAFDEAYEAHLIDRPIELVSRHVEGLPRGTSHVVLRAWQELADEGVVAIYGPNKSENLIAIRSYIETHGHVPTVTIAGSELNLGEWIFQVQSGSNAEEQYLIAGFLVREGARTISVVHESNATGDETLRMFLNASRRHLLSVIHYEQIGQTQTDMAHVARRLRESECDAVVYLGYGFPVVELAREFEAMGWSPLRVMGSAFQTAMSVAATGLGWVEGWVGVDFYDEGNEVAQSFLKRFSARFGYRPANGMACYCFDSGQVLAHGIANARPLSPAGVRRGLEAVKWLPAATGGAGTLLNLGPYMHRALVGPTFMVLREAVNGTGTWESEMPTVLRYREAT